jgi:hypothetical protein
MARTRTIDPDEVVRRFRSGEFKYGSEAARVFGCSRVRINQILHDHAPDLIMGKLKPRTKREQSELAKRQRKMVDATRAAILKYETIPEAAASLGLTSSGLYNRIRRFSLGAREGSAARASTAA